MTRMSQSLDLLVWSCLFLAVESQQGPVLPLQNLSLLWVADFKAELSWAPPLHSGAKCRYNVTWLTKSNRRNIRRNAPVKGQYYIVMEGGFLNMTVEAICGNYSEQAWVSVNYPELVRNLKCYIHSATQTHCSWQPASQAQDLRFFYQLLNSAGESYTLQECPAYSPSGSSKTKTGCDLDLSIDQTINILFNGTVNNTLARNSFKKSTSDDVRPPALDWTVTKTRDKFFIRWTPPEIKIHGTWTYTINYTECSETKIRTVPGETSMELDLNPRCAYHIAIKASTNKGETPYSAAKSFGADTDPNAWLYAAIIIPVMLAGLVALVLVCCRKNKEYIFPKVPEPRDLLSDISDNNNKGMDHNLYVPAEEDDNCKITLVVDPLINKLDF